MNLATFHNKQKMSARYLWMLENNFSKREIWKDRIDLVFIDVVGTIYLIVPCLQNAKVLFQYLLLFIYYLIVYINYKKINK